MLLLLLLSPVQACTGPALFCQQDLLNLQKNNPADQDYLLQTPEGQVQGRALTSAAGQTFGSWEGVPYGEQPKRWSPPEPKQQWEGVLDCTDLGPICMQYALDSDPLDSDVTVIGQEDCLSLNIYQPTWTEEPLPVFVWVHGGGLEMGSGGEYRPEMMVDEDMVVVTINYRLGALGFLSTDTPRFSGNQGLRDIQLALAWVQERISLFGGDPTRVTVAGQSGGSWAVSLLLASPLSNGLFSRAILQSGPVQGPGYNMDDRQVAAEKGRNMGNAVGCPTEWAEEMEECLLLLPVEALIKYKGDFSQSATSMGAVDDFAPDPVLPLPYKEAISQGIGPQVPVMVGENSFEGLLFSLPEVGDPNILDSYDWNSGFGVSTVFFDTLNMDLSLYSPCLPTWAEAAGLEFFGEALDSKDLLAYLHLQGDTKFGVGNSMSADLFNSAPNITVYRYLHTFQDNTSYSFAGTTEWGPTHGDELPYLWILPSYGWSDTSTWSSLAKQHSQLLLSLWSSFTDSGRPSSEGVEWRPYTPGGEYLQMGDQAVMGFGEGESRFAWWRNLLEQGC